jgi:hypothetical protein
LRADVSKRWQSAEQMADRIDAILVKLGQPSGPAPLKRWLETLSTRDGVKRPPIEASAASDPSIAVELGSLDIELEEVPPTAVDDGPHTGADTRNLGARTRPEATAHNAPTRQDSGRVALLARADREDVLSGHAVTTAGVVVRVKRWVRRTTIRVAVVVVALGGAFYFAHPHLPRWATEPVDGWLRRLPAPLGSGPVPGR